ncbi:MAG: phosphatidylserine/phosphatidylglycerophosphate/cardiolipin synthase family protein [Deltaproteobacteria bacterium]|nr:phosphatidylserine/phosphatidylglycerophosphate/cardiolipin synthase family protein [Deltaproteobacteria bacterium]
MIVFKNIRVRPEKATNDRPHDAEVRCTVLTTTDGAKLRSVRADLSEFGGPIEQAMTLDGRERLSSTMEGEYSAKFRINELADTGTYEIPLFALDTEGTSGRRTARLPVEYRRPSGLPRFTDDNGFSALARAAGARVSAVSRVEILWDGDAAFKRRLLLIENAKRQINIQVYLLVPNGRIREITNALMKKAEEGVEVNLLVNTDTQLPSSPFAGLRFKVHRVLLDLESLSKTLESKIAAKEDVSGEELLDLVKKLGTGKRGVNLVMFSRQSLQSLGDRRPSENEHAVWVRNLVGTGEVEKAVVSTLSEWASPFRGAGGLPSLPLLDYAIHDKLMVVDGERAIIGGRNLDERYFSPWVDLDLYLEGPVVHDIQAGIVRSLKEFSRSGTTTLPTRLPRPAVSPPFFCQSRPWDRENAPLHLLVRAMQMARERLFISSQYVVLPPGLLRDALLDAAERGVDVRLLTNSHRTGSEIGLATGFLISLNYFSDLLTAGARIFEFRGTDNPEEEQPYYHAKEFLVDGRVAIVGSFNLSARSCYVESESLIAIDDAALTGDLERAFLSRLDARADEITRAKFTAYWDEHRTAAQLAKRAEILY